MAERKMRVMLVGCYDVGNLESSYRTAFELLGWEVRSFDIVEIINRYTRFGSLGHLFNTFVPVEPWIRKANRDLALAAIEFEPELVVTFGYYPIQVGSLAQIRACSDAALVHVWPDTLLNWNADLTACLPLYDLVATYSQTSVEIFERLGAKRVAWVPLAGDPCLHTLPTQRSESNEFDADVCFIGGWRPERESILSQLDGVRLKIWGPDWGRRVRGNRVILKAWQGRALRGSEFAQAVARSRINLNIIDPANYPAANMRFFEISVAGGLQVSSPCPEMEGEFRHGEHIFYYRDAEQLPDLIRSLLADETLSARVALATHQKVLESHTYTHRARSILEVLGMEPRGK